MGLTVLPPWGAPRNQQGRGPGTSLNVGPRPFRTNVVRRLQRAQQTVSLESNGSGNKSQGVWLNILDGPVGRAGWMGKIEKER